MTYDIFISYTSLDRLWAEKVSDILSSKGLNVFLDNQRLVAGNQWEDQLKIALNDSKHMVCIWSENAKNSDWVMKETAFFSVAISNTNRKLFQIVLNDMPRAYTSLQAILDIKEGNYYSGGPASAPAILWQKIVGRILESVELNNSHTPISLAILTIDKPELESLDFNWKPFLGESLNTLLNQAGYSRNEIISHYGDNKDEWKPFGGQQNIVSTLDEILLQINQKSAGNQFRWIRPDIWSNNTSEFLGAIDNLKKELAVVVVDPVALYHDDVRARFDSIMDCLENKDALLMSFSAFESAPSYNTGRKLIEYTANRFHKNYFSPPIPKSNLLAQFTPNPLDKKDAGRFIQNMISESKIFSKKSSNPFLNQ